jgi:hypothetical protein
MRVEASYNFGFLQILSFLINPAVRLLTFIKVPSTIEKEYGSREK